VFIFNNYDYAGTFFAFAVLGPVVAFIIGGFLLDTYTHFDTIDTSTLVDTLCALALSRHCLVQVIVVVSLFFLGNISWLVQSLFE